MKARDLAKQLMKYPEWDVHFRIFERDNTDYGASVRDWAITGIDPDGHSDKTLLHNAIEES